MDSEESIVAAAEGGRSAKEAPDNNTDSSKNISRLKTSSRTQNRSVDSVIAKSKTSIKLNEKPVYRGTGRRARERMERMRREIEKREEEKRQLLAEKEERRKKYRETQARKFAEKAEKRKDSFNKPAFILTFQPDKKPEGTKNGLESKTEKPRKRRTESVNHLSTDVKARRSQRAKTTEDPRTSVNAEPKAQEQQVAKDDLLKPSPAPNPVHKIRSQEIGSSAALPLVSELPAAAATAAHIMQEVAASHAEPVEVNLSNAISDELEATAYQPVAEMGAIIEQDELAVLAKREFSLHLQEAPVYIGENRSLTEDAKTEQRITYEAFTEALLELSSSAQEGTSEGTLIELSMDDPDEQLLTIEDKPQPETAVVVEVAKRLQAVEPAGKETTVALVVKVSEAVDELQKIKTDSTAELDNPDVMSDEAHAELEAACITLLDHLGIEHDEVKVQQFTATLLKSHFIEQKNNLQSHKKEERKYSLKQSLQYLLSMLSHILQESSSLQANIGRFALFFTHPRALVPLVATAAR